MKNTKYAVMIVVSKVMWKYDQLYCYASQQKMLELLKEHHKIVISRRQLNYHLADLRREGLLKTWKRHFRDRKGRIHLKTSANSLSIKGCIYLIKMGVIRAIHHLKTLQKKYGGSVPKPPRTDSDNVLFPSGHPKVGTPIHREKIFEEKLGIVPGTLVIN